MKKTVVILLALSLIVSLSACKSSDYKEAMELYEDERYSRARDMFAELGDYENSAEMVAECDYQQALAYMDDGEYSQARTLFAALGDYKDSAEQLKECDYQQALICLDNGSFDQAYVLIQELGDYKNCGELIACAARGMLIRYVKETAIPDYEISSDSFVRIWEENGNLVMAYEMELSGIIGVDVSIGARIAVDGTAAMEGSEECWSYAADWEAEASSSWDFGAYKSGDEVYWDDIDASGYNANGQVHDDESTLMIRMLHQAAIEKVTTYLAQVLAESGLGLTMGDIGFTSY